MGAIFDVPLARVASVDDLPGTGVALVAGDGLTLRGPAEGERRCSWAPSGPACRAEVVAAGDRPPDPDRDSESLNAAMAATVALYELTRGTGWRR